MYVSEYFKPLCITQEFLNIVSCSFVSNKENALRLNNNRSESILGVRTEGTVHALFFVIAILLEDTGQPSD